MTGTVDDGTVRSVDDDDDKKTSCQVGKLVGCWLLLVLLTVVVVGVGYGNGCCWCRLVTGVR